MKNIIIVEDRLPRAISLAKQVQALFVQKDNLVENIIIVYFNANEQLATEEVKKHKSDFPINIVNIDNFAQTLDQYLYDEKSKTFIPCDFLLEHDDYAYGYGDYVNMRYARNNNRKNTNQLYFYTAAGSVLISILGDLVGKRHCIKVASLQDENLLLDFSSCKTFLKHLKTP